MVLFEGAAEDRRAPTEELLCVTGWAFCSTVQITTALIMKWSQTDEWRDLSDPALPCGDSLNLKLLCRRVLHPTLDRNLTRHLQSDDRLLLSRKNVLGQLQQRTVFEIRETETCRPSSH